MFRRECPGENVCSPVQERMSRRECLLSCPGDNVHEIMSMREFLLSCPGDNVCSPVTRDWLTVTVVTVVTGGVRGQPTSTATQSWSRENRKMEIFQFRELLPQTRGSLRTVRSGRGEGEGKESPNYHHFSSFRGKFLLYRPRPTRGCQYLNRILTATSLACTCWSHHNQILAKLCPSLSLSLSLSLWFLVSFYQEKIRNWSDAWLAGFDLAHWSPLTISHLLELITASLSWEMNRDRTPPPQIHNSIGQVPAVG